MKTETIATRNLKEYMERNNAMPTREDVVNILSMLPLFIDTTLEIPNHIELTTSNNEKKTSSEKNTRKKKNNNNDIIKDANKSSMEILNDVRTLQSKLGKMPTMEDLKNANIDIAPLLKTCGGWRNLKKSLNDNTKNDEIVKLMYSLNKIPTREDLKENNIDISNLLIEYGSWRNIKKELHLEDAYEELLKNKLMELKKTDKLSMENCKENNIDIAFLVRKYGGWKEACKQLGLK